VIRAALLAAAVSLAGTPPAPDKAYRDALDLLYDGSTDTALERLAALAQANPDDPMGGYFEALAFSWKVEQRPESTELDHDLHRRLDRILAATATRLRAAPGDARAHLARGGAFGLRSRFYLFRLKGREAAKAAEAMRSELRLLRDDDELAADAAFGLGLYDYYVDVLPRAAKLLRFLSGMPGGDRARGLAAIRRAKEQAAFHRVEAAWQLYEIHAYYEDNPDPAWEQVRHLHDEYPGSPLWALKLAEHERDRLGRYAASAAVAREIVRSSASEPNYGPVTEAFGRLALGESLLLDLRLAEARRALLWFKNGFAAAPWLALRARLLLGRLLELEGDRDAALAHYRAAAASPEKDMRERAEKAARQPLPEAQVKAVPHLAEARRAREAGRASEALVSYRAALEEWPSCAEARLRIAEHELRRGTLAAGRAHLAELEDATSPEPPWVRPWTRLLRAWAHDLDDEREAAVVLYKKVLEAPYRDELLTREARVRLRQPFRRDPVPETQDSPR